jgi:putative effector of murein hydrolase LrgA (UPF0299 family)
MRVLGVAKRGIYTINFTEQFLLISTGLLTGSFIVYIFEGKVSNEVCSYTTLFTCLYYIAILAASYLTSALITRKSIIKLLQIKE